MPKQPESESADKQAMETEDSEIDNFIKAYEDVVLNTELRLEKVSMPVPQPNTSTGRNENEYETVAVDALEDQASYVSVENEDQAQGPLQGNLVSIEQVPGFKNCNNTVEPVDVSEEVSHQSIPVQSRSMESNTSESVALLNQGEAETDHKDTNTAESADREPAHEADIATTPPINSPSRNELATETENNLAFAEPERQEEKEHPVINKDTAVITTHDIACNRLQAAPDAAEQPRALNYEALTAKVAVKHCFFKGSVSDVEEVSTDEEFIKTNITDKKAKEEHGENNGAQPGSKREMQKQSAKCKININRHVVPTAMNGEAAFETAVVEENIVPAPDNEPTTDMQQVEPNQDDTPAQNTEQPIVNTVTVPPCQDDSQADNDNFMHADLVALINELNAHTIGRKGPDESLPQNRYVIVPTRPIISIDDVIEISDFRERDIYDIIQRRTSTGRFKQCWVQVINGQLLCYRSTPRKEPPITQQAHKVFTDPSNDQMIYDVKYTIDLGEAKFYLSKGPNSRFTQCFCCYSLPLPSSQLFDISESKIRYVSAREGKYAIDMHKDGSLITVCLPHLDFVLEYQNTFHYMRACSIDVFLKWVLIYHLRRERRIRCLN